MDRISFNLPYDDARFYTEKREKLLQKTANSLASQQKIPELRDDPVSASHAVRYQSVSFRLNRFVDNIDQIRGHNQIAEGYLRNSVDILQKLRELAVQMANGIYTEEERKIASNEVDQFLRQLVENANARTGDGTRLFGGLQTTSDPFRIVTGVRATGEKEYISTVEYLGDQGRRWIEVNEGTLVAQNIPGSELFWAKNDRIFSQVDASAYVVRQRSSVFIDGNDIQLEPGDTIGSIVQKINDSPAAVQAGIDPVSNGLTLETTTPHRLWLKDEEGSTILEDLGIVNKIKGLPPYNISETAVSFSGSIFDMIIQFQERLINNDMEAIGSSTLRGVDDSIQSLLTGLASYGALDERLSVLSQRVSMNIIEVDTLHANAAEVDYAQAMTQLKKMEYAHQVSLAVTARVLQQSLLDYLR